MKNKRICAIPALKILVNFASKVGGLRLVEVNDQRERASVHVTIGWHIALLAGLERDEFHTSPQRRSQS